MKMAWYTEQIFADFLNQNNNHLGARKALMSVLDDHVVLEYGRSTYEGVNDVVDFLEQTRTAISSDQGFTAKPLITKDAEGNRKKAVALFSKLEDYISWLFRIKGNPKTGYIVSIKAERPDGYDLYYDFYIEGNYDDDGNTITSITST